MSKEKKTLAENLNDTGNRIREFGTVITIAGAILISAGFIINYFRKLKEK